MTSKTRRPYFFGVVNGILENKYYHRVKAWFWNYSSLLPWITRWAKKYRGFWFEGKELGSILSLGLILWVKDLKGVFNQIKGELLDLSQRTAKVLACLFQSSQVNTDIAKGKIFNFLAVLFFLWIFHKKANFTKKKCSELGQGPGEKALVIRIAFVAGRTNGFANGWGGNKCNCTGNLLLKGTKWAARKQPRQLQLAE